MAEDFDAAGEAEILSKQIESVMDIDSSEQVSN